MRQNNHIIKEAENGIDTNHIISFLWHSVCFLGGATNYYCPCGIHYNFIYYNLLCYIYSCRALDLSKKFHQKKNSMKNIEFMLHIITGESTNDSPYSKSILPIVRCSQPIGCKNLATA